MATYRSNRRYASAPGNGLGGNFKVATGEVAVDTSLDTSDTIEFFKMPAGATILYALLEADDLDSATGITINVGDSGSATRIFSASTVGQAGTASAASAATGLFYTYSAETLVTGALQANATGAQAGSIRLAIGYVLP